jgi:putative transposase
LFEENKEWLLKVPAQIRNGAVRDLIKAFKTVKTLVKNKIIRSFDMKFKSKKRDGESSIVIPKQLWKHKQLPKGFGVLKANELLPDQLPTDCRLIKTPTGKFYLCLVQPLEIRSENQRPSQHSRVLALDPGIRTFLTGYDPSGYIYEWGANDIKRIRRLYGVCNQLKSMCDQQVSIQRKRPTIMYRSKRDNKLYGEKECYMNHRKRYKIKNVVITRIKERIQNLINELHRKCIKWIIENFTFVLLPKFEVSRLVMKVQNGKRRKIDKKTTRSLLSWNHYKFRMRLLSKIREYPWCKVELCNESYTSKTCGQCGFIHEKLEGNKTFKCPQCNFTCDRDHNASRNIWLKHLTET